MISVKGKIFCSEKAARIVHLAEECTVSLKVVSQILATVGDILCGQKIFYTSVLSGEINSYFAKNWLVWLAQVVEQTSTAFLLASSMLLK